VAAVPTSPQVQLQAPRPPPDDPDGDERFAVYASPARHPFCFGVH
jgi:hypothetical protein